MTQTLNEVAFDKLLAHQKPFRLAQPVFDLRGFRFITPAGLVPLAAACYSLAAKGVTPTIVTNDNQLLDYLARVDFVGIVGQVARFVPSYQEVFSVAPVTSRGQSRWLVELTKLEKWSDLCSFPTTVINLLRTRFSYPRRTAHHIGILVSEIGQNVLDHAGSSNCGFFAMQVYQLKQGRRLDLCIADAGDGLAQTLCQNSRYQDVDSDLKAIRRAVEVGASRYADQTHGTGLSHLLRLTQEYAGMLQIRSGTGVVRFTPDQPAGWGIHVPAMPGVQISLSLPLARKP